MINQYKLWMTAQTLIEKMCEVGARVFAHILAQCALLTVHPVHCHQQLLILKPSYTK